MSHPPYTSIPDTSDTRYWVHKFIDRGTTFVPRDKALHQKLRIEAWSVIQASLTKKNRKESKY